MPASFQIDMQELDRIVAGLAGGAVVAGAELRTSIRTVVEAVWVAARSRVKVRTGRTRDSIFRTISGMSGWVGPTSVSGMILETGARPHEITAHGQALFIPERPNGVGGFYKSVHHPGAKPQPYMQQAMEASTPLIEAELARMGSAVLAAMKNGT